MIDPGIVRLQYVNQIARVHTALPTLPAKSNSTPQPYRSLQPILVTARPFHTITIDFILALPRSTEDYDCVLSITDEFSKAVTLLPGKTTWSEKEWAIKVIDRLALLNWGLPRAILSDRDRKFVGQLWKENLVAIKVSSPQ